MSSAAPGTSRNSPHGIIDGSESLWLVIQDTRMWSSADQCTNMHTIDDWRVMFDGKVVQSIIATILCLWVGWALDIASVPTRPPSMLRPFNLEESCKLNGVIWNGIDGDMRWRCHGCIVDFSCENLGRWASTVVKKTSGKLPWKWVDVDDVTFNFF